MAERFKIIVFTSPDYIDREAVKLIRLFDAGVDRIHIRKPDWSSERICSVIRDIPYLYRERLTVHDCFDAAVESGVGGIHLNSRNADPIPGVSVVSKSCHSIDELKDAPRYCYVTLSPIFDSISKAGYRSRFNLDVLEQKIRDKNVIALGGVTPQSFFMLREKGFYGAGLLGYIWEGDFETVLKELSQYIREL